jgi:hypothetical protein
LHTRPSHFQLNSWLLTSWALIPPFLRSLAPYPLQFPNPHRSPSTPKSSGPQLSQRAPAPSAILALAARPSRERPLMKPSRPSCGATPRPTALSRRTQLRRRCSSRPSDTVQNQPCRRCQSVGIAWRASAPLRRPSSRWRRQRFRCLAECHFEPVPERALSRFTLYLSLSLSLALSPFFFLRTDEICWS